MSDRLPGPVLARHLRDERDKLREENEQLKGIIRELLRESEGVPGDLRYRATALLAGGVTPSETTAG